MKKRIYLGKFLLGFGYALIFKQQKLPKFGKWVLHLFQIRKVQHPVLTKQTKQMNLINFGNTR